MFDLCQKKTGCLIRQFFIHKEIYYQLLNPELKYLESHNERL